MSAIDLMERVGGEVLGHKIRATIDGQIVVIARMEGNEFALTDEGQKLADKLSNEDAAPKAKGKSKAKAADAPETTTEADAAVESTPVAPEQ
jgi:hypothetical protein